MASSIMTTVLTTLLLLALLVTAYGLSVLRTQSLLIQTRHHRASHSIKLQMSTPSGKTPLVANGKRFEAEPGSSLIQACAKLGLKVPTDCKKGQCGMCTVTVAGTKIKSCVGKVPPPPRLKSLIEKGLPVSVDNAR